MYTKANKQKFIFFPTKLHVNILFNATHSENSSLCQDRLQLAVSFFFDRVIIFVYNECEIDVLRRDFLINVNTFNS